jgi:signal peptidase I
MTVKRRKISILKIVIITISVIVSAIAGGLLFHRFYYTSIYVDGQSMYPTLNQNGTRDRAPERVEYGIVDTHFNIDQIRRFDIVATYYPEDYNEDGDLLMTAVLKIKRVMVLPNETFRFTLGGDLYVNNNLILQDFYPPEFRDYIKDTAKTSFKNRTLGADEFWVMGDNRGHSRDSQSEETPIVFSSFFGVLKAIEGTCTLDNTQGTCTNRRLENIRFF